MTDLEKELKKMIGKDPETFFAQLQKELFDPKDNRIFVLCLKALEIIEEKENHEG